MKKMRGAIDPWTLGFIISFLGGLTGYIVHPPGELNTIESDIELKQNLDEEKKEQSKKKGQMTKSSNPIRGVYLTWYLLRIIFLELCD